MLQVIEELLDQVCPPFAPPPALCFRIMFPLRHFLLSMLLLLLILALLLHFLPKFVANDRSAPAPRGVASLPSVCVCWLQVEDTTKMTLVYCSQNPAEIILKDHLDQLAELWPGRLCDQTPPTHAHARAHSICCTAHSFHREFPVRFERCAAQHNERTVLEYGG